MIEWIVFAIVILFMAFFLYFWKASAIMLIINIILGIFLALFIEMDLKKKELHNYYLLSLVAIAVVFILSGTWLFSWLFYLFGLAKLNIYIQALTLAFVFPHLIKIAHEAYRKKPNKKSK